MELLLWMIPVLVAGMYATFSSKRISEVIALGLALLVLAVMVKRPGPALVTLVIVLPILAIGSGLLLGLHVPAGFLRQASSIKELLAVSVLGAAVAELVNGRQKLDRIDRIGLAYVAVVTAYLFVPHLFSSTAPTALSVRLLAWRSDCAYVLLFIAARHAPITDRMKRRFVQAVLAMGALTAAVALYQRADTAGWTRFVFQRAHIIKYFTVVLHQTAGQAYGAIAYVAFVRPLRVSSIFLNPNDMSDYLVFVVALVAERIVRDRKSPWNYLLLAMCVAALFFSEVRADTLGALVVIALVVLPAPRRAVEARIRLIMALVIGAAIIVPALGGSRFVGGQGGNKASTGHIAELQFGVRVLEHHPFGLGLGDQPSTAARFQSQTNNQTQNDISDDSYLQVGDELGIQAMLPWLGFVGMVLLEARRRASRGDGFAAAAGLGLLGVLIAGLYHHVFLLFPAPWTIWATVGLALSTYRDRPPPGTASHEAEPELPAVL